MSREVRATQTAAGPATQIRVGSHTLTADEPPGSGGADGGPTPIELLLASLAACKAITVRLYAARKGWPLTDVQAVARVASMAGFTPETIEVEMRFEGDLTEEQRARLHDIAEKCPIQKAIAAGIRVVPVPNPT